MIDIILTTEEAKRLEVFIGDHRAMCMNYLYDDAVPEDWEPYDLYDGCETCETREHLMATFDWLKSNGKVDIYVGD
jgi:hypothetical protein